LAGSAGQPLAGTQVTALWHSSGVGQVTVAPATQLPDPLQWSGVPAVPVQALLSLHVCVVGAKGVVQVPPALQAPVRWQMSSAGQLTVPVQLPAPSQWSDVVQALPSLQTVADEAGGAVQFPTPSHAPAVWQTSMAGHVTVPMQVPDPLQWSDVVQDLPSLQL
jgi:hypothetical protein